MSCPSCGAELRAGESRCASCGTLTAPPVEGALAPKPDPLRELPGGRKKEKSWRDEVNERVRSRRKRREAEKGLPLFDGMAPSDAPEEEKKDAPSPSEPPPLVPRFGLEDAEIAAVVEEPVADLPLRAAHPSPAPPGEPVASGAPEGGEEDKPARPPEEEWPLELEPPAPQGRPVERPALAGERARAGALDFLLLCLMGLVVVYFASRAARVPLSGLLAAWPWLAGYLAFLGVVYATYFTGTTGQTVGKMLLGLRVVDTAGQPPGYFRALLRAALGAVGLALAGLGLLPMGFDPARRALHDRVFRTRVIRG
jgi:uncharacterized RDD family membrane protein YckC